MSSEVLLGKRLRLISIDFNESFTVWSLERSLSWGSRSDWIPRERRFTPRDLKSLKLRESVDWRKKKEEEKMKR